MESDVVLDEGRDEIIGVVVPLPHVQGDRLIGLCGGSHQVVWLELLAQEFIVGSLIDQHLVVLARTTSF